jgi:hypothetical protein
MYIRNVSRNFLRPSHNAHARVSTDCLVGPGDQEPADLHLLDVVEAQHAHEAVGVLLLALLNLTQHLRGVVAPEHGQLPHGPVAPVIVPGALVVLTRHSLGVQVELKARDQLLLDHVVHLLGDLVIGHSRQVRERLELGLANGVPHLHTSPTPIVGKSPHSP